MFFFFFFFLGGGGGGGISLLSQKAYISKSLQKYIKLHYALLMNNVYRKNGQ